MLEEIRELNLDRKFLVAEIFGPTIQGEGPLIGRQTMFIRFAGCDFRCSWCDSMHAVDNKHWDSWRKMTGAEIIDELHAMAPEPMLITLSGGNPGAWELDPVINEGRALGYHFACETQGSIPQAWFQRLWQLVISPKGPSSGMAFDPIALGKCISLGPPGRTALKFVIDDVEDLKFARAVSKSFPRMPVYLQPANDWLGDDDSSPSLGRRVDLRLEKLRWLTSTVMAVGWHRAIILPQLHVLMWGNRRAV